MQLSEIRTAAARLGCAMALFASMPMVAHHSYAMFDTQKEVALEGTVKDFQWTNPHVWIDIVVIDKTTGQPANWSIEGKGPVQLVRDGWRRDSVKQGDKVSLVIHPLKSGSNGGSLAKILVNGKEISGDSKGQ
jgi:hypothetical protein